MSYLSPASAAAIARLRSYVPPPTAWHSLPLSRRAAVLILLFADRKGDLRVVLTMRAATLKSYAGQAALPGGKSDSLNESPLVTARREANEEIGLPTPEYAPKDGTSGTSRDSQPESTSVQEDTKYSPETPDLPYPFRLEHLCQLPSNLAKTELGVRPCVAFLYATSPVDRVNRPVDAEAALIPRLDAKEVAAVFSGPFHNFLRKRDELTLEPDRSHDADEKKGRSQWYRGSWIDWHETRFRMHNFYVPIDHKLVSRPLMPTSEQQVSKGLHSSYPPSRSGTTLPYRDQPANKQDPLEGLSRFRVFGMTARILVDCARVAYAEEPEFEHNAHFGDEDIIRRLINVGRLDGERDKGDEFVGGDGSVRNALRHERL